MTTDFTPTVDNLTPREKEVLKLIGEGLTSKKIATLLNVSPKTVGSHRASIRNKLRVSNAAGMVRYAIKFNLVS